MLLLYKHPPLAFRKFFFFSTRQAEPNPYEVLGLSSNSNITDIKKSYFKLSKLYHPDVNKSPNAEEKFKQINKAYTILKEIHGEKSTASHLYNKYRKPSSSSDTFYKKNDFYSNSQSFHETFEEKLYREIFGRSYRDDPMSFYRPENANLKKKYEEKLREKKGYSKETTNETGGKDQDQNKKGGNNEEKEEVDRDKRMSRRDVVVENRMGTIVISLVMIGALLIGGLIFSKDYYGKNREKRIFNLPVNDVSYDVEEIRKKSLNRSKMKMEKAKQDYLNSQENMKYYPMERNPNAADLLVDYSILPDLKLYSASSNLYYQSEKYTYDSNFEKNRLNHLRINNLLGFGLEAERSLKKIYIKQSKLKEILSKQGYFEPPGLFIRFFGFIYIKLRKKPILIDNLSNDDSKLISLFDLYFRYTSPLPSVHENHYEFPIDYGRYIPDTTTHEGAEWLGKVTMNHRNLSTIILNGDEKNVFLWKGDKNNKKEELYIKIWDNFYNTYLNK